MDNNKNKAKKLIIKVELLILAVVSVVEIYILASSNPAIKNAIVIATTHQPERFTELYFQDHLNLPKIITRGEQYSFTFTLHNLEYKDTEYPYVIYLQRDSQKIILDQGSLSLKADGYKSVNESFGPLKNLRSKIVVDLVNKNQLIDFWMEKQ